MSTLTLSVIALVTVVIGAVVLFNFWQSRANRREAERLFRQETGVLDEQAGIARRRRRSFSRPPAEDRIPGDDDATLSKAVGHLPDTPLPWSGGNTALAGHRDTYFRPLQRAQAGDDIFLDTPRGRFHYRVRRTFIVEPEDVWVLDPSAQHRLTLITCYPFRYVGAAPKRFIVQADRV